MQLLFFLLPLVPVVLLLELLDAAGRVEELHLAGEERVRRTGNIELDERVLFAVAPLDRVIRFDRGPRQEREIRRRVHEHDRPVIRMDFLFHNSPAFPKPLAQMLILGKNTAHQQEGPPKAKGFDQQNE